MSRRPLLGLIIVAVLLVSGILLLTGPEDEGLPLDASDQADGPSEPSTDYPVYGDGDILVSFEVEVPNGTPPEDMVFLQFDGYYHTSGWGVPMEEVEPGVWAVSFLAPADTPLTYKYNRNNGEYPTDEEFTPDSRETRRSLTVASSLLQVSDTVDKWRWLEHTQPQAVYSDYVPDDLPERDESFIGRHTLIGLLQRTLRRLRRLHTGQDRRPGLRVCGVRICALLLHQQYAPRVHTGACEYIHQGAAGERLLYGPGQGVQDNVERRPGDRPPQL